MRVALCIALVMAPPAQGQARQVLLSDISAGKLADLCAGSDGTLRDPCVQYITGVYDAEALREKVCIPASGTMKQMAAVVIQALRNNPALWHEPAAFFVSQRLRQVFPCKGES